MLEANLNAAFAKMLVSKTPWMAIPIALLAFMLMSVFGIGRAASVNMSVLPPVEALGPDGASWRVSSNRLNLLRSANVESEWDTAFTSPRGKIIDIHFGPDDALVLTNEEGAVWQTLDHGLNWQQMNKSATHAIHRIAWRDYRTALAVGPEGAISRTTDVGKTWQPVHSGVREHLFGVAFVDKNIAWAAGEKGRLLFSKDAGASWERRASGVMHTLLDVEFKNADMGFAVGYNGTLTQTLNGGWRWHGKLPGTRDLHYTDIDIDSGRLTLLTNRDSRTLISHNDGQTWQVVSDKSDTHAALSPGGSRTGADWILQ